MCVDIDDNTVCSVVEPAAKAIAASTTAKAAAAAIVVVVVKYICAVAALAEQGRLGSKTRPVR